MHDAYRLVKWYLLYCYNIAIGICVMMEFSLILVKQILWKLQKAAKSTAPDKMAPYS